MTTTIYRNYGVLAHEKQNVYATYPSEINDEIEVEIPEELNPYETESGEICIKPESSDFHLIRDVICSRTGKPAVAWYDKNGNERWMHLIEK